MSRRSDSGARTGARSLVMLVGAAMSTLALATVAYAAISPISPSSGTIEPGESITATFTLQPDLFILTCLSASVSPAFEGTVELDPSCAVLEDESVDMTVTAGLGAAPGNYTVSIVELLSGDVVATHEWPFTVVATTTTTTTTSTTTTTTTPTTTTSSTTSTTTQATTTSTQPGQTTTTQPGQTTTTQPGQTSATQPGQTTADQPGQTTSSTTPSASGAAATTTTNTSISSATASTITPTTAGTDTTQPPDADPSDTAPGDQEVAASPYQGPPYDRGGARSGFDGPGFLAGNELTQHLRNQFSRIVPLPLADAVLSPLLVAEFLLRSLLRGAMGLLIPIFIASLIGLWMVWRMREEVARDELSLSAEPMV